MRRGRHRTATGSAKVRGQIAARQLTEATGLSEMLVICRLPAEQRVLLWKADAKARGETAIVRAEGASRGPVLRTHPDAQESGFAPPQLSSGTSLIG